MTGLLALAEAEGVYISYQPLLPNSGLLGMYFRDRQGRPFIILDEGLHQRPRLQRCVLAEEMGHHLTMPVSTFCVAHFSYSRAIAISKDEARALRWASDYLIPTERLAEAVAGGADTVSEIAEHFDVTKWMVWRKLQFLRADLREQMKLRVR